MPVDDGPPAKPTPVLDGFIVHEGTETFDALGDTALHLEMSFTARGIKQAAGEITAYVATTVSVDGEAAAPPPQYAANNPGGVFGETAVAKLLMKAVSGAADTIFKDLQDVKNRCTHLKTTLPEVGKRYDKAETNNKKLVTDVTTLINTQEPVPKPTGTAK